MPLMIYNTLTRTKEEFKPLEDNVVRMYVCGPTVYDKAHVGHAMSAIVFDVIRRYLEYKGYRVIHVMNFTDVDDKIIHRANQLGEDPIHLAERYITEFMEHIRALGLLPATVYPRATQEIPQIIQVIQGLIEKGYAYQANGDVYFRVRKDDDYGKLSHRKVEEMRAGARIAPGEQKEDPLDFALWKAAKPGEPAWDSPWGPGRPGWHIECSAMNLHHLGPQIDIHGGGNDLIFPHHENEIAQSESYTGQPFARYWVHNGMLQLGGEKMSKSLGNLVTIEEFLAEHEANTLRLIVLGSHYRSPLTFSDEVIEQAERALERLRSALRPSVGEIIEGPQVEALMEQVRRTRERFESAMDDDFNTAGALAALFDLVRAINAARDAGVGGAPFAQAQATLCELAGVLGLRLAEDAAKSQRADVAPFIRLLVDVRARLRQAKQWQLADAIRDGLAELGVVLEDTPQGTIWRFK
ncbi:MAG: cysteine--tRNA ligase [Anaerolineae bacterium]|nr:cysteine--tRNA ligase [Anaerolineae bacterium]MDW8100633.1 cysteine--tRNA ligase [Anaerolineae bacterium]